MHPWNLTSIFSPAPPTPTPALQGNWSAVHCACRCINQLAPALPGFCPDPATGICNVVKQYDLASKTFYCGDSAPPGSSPAPGSGTGSGAGSGTVPATPQQPEDVSLPDPDLPLGSIDYPPLVTKEDLAVGDSSGLMADVQPLGGAQFSFVVQAQLSAFVGRVDAVCGALAALAGEAPAACTIASVTETSAPAGKRLLAAASGAWCVGHWIAGMGHGQARHSLSMTLVAACLPACLACPPRLASPPLQATSASPWPSSPPTAPRRRCLLPWHPHCGTAAWPRRCGRWECSWQLPALAVLRC